MDASDDRGQRVNVEESLYEQGMATRREVLGDEHVDRAQASATRLDEAFQRLVTEVAWGSLWSRDGIDRRTRSLITIAIIAALGREDELKLHLRASRRTGTAPEEIVEALLHVAVYAGLPAANTAFAITKKVLAEDDET